MANKKKAALILFGKKMISIRLDTSVLAFFKSMGRGWQTEINRILKEHMEKRK